MQNKSHPVWTVYNKLRTARLNVKYYCRRLERAEAISMAFDLILAASAPTSAVAGLWFWNTEYGKHIWQWFGVIAALASLLKPILSPSKKIKDFEGVIVGYKALEYDLMSIKDLVQQKGKYDSVLQASFKRALDRERMLVGKSPETRESRKVIELCEVEVRTELPDSVFFTPEVYDDRQENSNAATTTSSSTESTPKLPDTSKG